MGKTTSTKASNGLRKGGGKIKGLNRNFSSHEKGIEIVTRFQIELYREPLDKGKGGKVDRAKSYINEKIDEGGRASRYSKEKVGKRHKDHSALEGERGPMTEREPTLINNGSQGRGSTPGGKAKGKGDSLGRETSTSEKKLPKEGGG